ncbi:hypothetical protein GCM10027046_13770 [Uliginosibacterium flavum]
MQNGAEAGFRKTRLAPLERIGCANPILPEGEPSAKPEQNPNPPSPSFCKGGNVQALTYDLRSGFRIQSGMT